MSNARPNDNDHVATEGDQGRDPSVTHRRPLWRRLLIPALSVVATLAAIGAFWAAYSGRPDAPASISTLSDGGDFRGITVDPPRDAPDFRMTAHTGEDFSMGSLRGQVALVFFGYTYCPDICPTTMARVGQGLHQLGDDAEGVTVVFVTVDPERDTLEGLARYLGNFHPSILGVRGDEDTISQAAKDYGVTYSVDAPPGATPDPKHYTVTHSGYVFLVDKNGRQRSAFLGDFTPDDVAHDVRMLLEE
jgi:protein SCO1/2